MFWIFMAAVAVFGFLLFQYLRSEPKPDSETNTPSPEKVERRRPPSHFKQETLPARFDFEVEFSSGPAQPIIDRAVPQFRICYVDADGVVTERDIFIDSSSGQGNTTIFHCWCFLRNEERSFRNDRIVFTKNLRTGRSIKNLAKYWGDYRNVSY